MTEGRARLRADSWRSGGQLGSSLSEQANSPPQFFLHNQLSLSMEASLRVSVAFTLIFQP